MRSLPAFVAAFLIGTSALSAQGLPADSVFARLAGKWVLRGTIAHQQTTHDVTFDWLLGHEYLQMHEISREREPDGKPSYEAVVVFGRDPKTGEYACIWMDNTASAAFPLEGTGRGSFVGDSLHFIFRDSSRVTFHNTFFYDRQADTWRWQMDNDSAGKRKPFGRVTLTRR